jgi:hypothetical protein
VVTSITPNAGKPGSQVNAVISGQNLGSPVSVSFAGGSVSASIQPGGDSMNLPVVVNVAPGASIGSQPLTVVTAGGSATLLNAFRVTSSPPPSTLPLPISDVETGGIRSGYVVVTPNPGQTAPLTTLTYGTVSGGQVQSQAAILPGPSVTQASLIVDVVPAIGRNLGVAIANISGTPATITLTLRDQDGTTAGAPVTNTLQNGQQLARLLTELFPASAIGGALQGSLTVQSSAPINLIGLYFSGVQFSTLPAAVTGFVLDTSNKILFPQFAMSGGWATTLGLMNASSTTLLGRIDIFDPSGNPLAVTLNGNNNSTFTYSIPPGASMVLAPRDSNGQSPF